MTFDLNQRDCLTLLDSTVEEIRYLPGLARDPKLASRVIVTVAKLTDLI